MKAPLLTPKGLLIRALLLGAPFVLCQALGLREYTTLLSGTAYAGSELRCQALCVTYLVCYFLAVLGAPMLMIASGFLAVWERWPRRMSGTP
jgi:hypothetical protein